VHVNWDVHALAPAIVITATIVVVLIADFFFEYRERFKTYQLASFGTLLAIVPILTLARAGGVRSLFGGAYVVDNYTLAMQAFFLIAAYITMLLSVDHIGEGDYYQGEYYVLLLTSTLGMMIMAGARDLITIFVALETISIPTFVLAGWRKHDSRSNEAAVKYFIIGVLSSALMLYGMSFVYGMAGTTKLLGIAAYAGTADVPVLFAIGILLTIVGFAFKVSAVPFHFWAPDTYEGAPVPVTAFLSVASKAGGFVALLNVIYFGFYPSHTSWQPVIWVLAALSMTYGNLVALRQASVIRMLAYSSIAQGGFMLVPFAVANSSAQQSSFEAVVVYILIYGAMNLGVFACVIAAMRRTRSAEITSFGGMFKYSPILAVMTSAFLFSLAGIPPLAGWFAKFVMFRAVLDAGTPAAVILGVIAALNSVIAFFYYAGVARTIWFRDVPAEVESTPLRTPFALNAAITITGVIVIVVGVYPQLFARIGELAGATL
jgi:NADH-quinone oxidoreductase subunit N